jgi:hypothetical protein
MTAYLWLTFFTPLILDEFTISMHQMMKQGNISLFCLIFAIDRENFHSSARRQGIIEPAPPCRRGQVHAEVARRRRQQQSNLHGCGSMHARQDPLALTISI